MFNRIYVRWDNGCLTSETLKILTNPKLFKRIRAWVFIHSKTEI